jgi:hypothetical protein
MVEALLFFDFGRILRATACAIMMPLSQTGVLEFSKDVRRHSND